VRRKTQRKREEKSGENGGVDNPPGILKVWEVC